MGVLPLGIGFEGGRGLENEKTGVLDIGGVARGTGTGIDDGKEKVKFLPDGFVVEFVVGENAKWNGGMEGRWVAGQEGALATKVEGGVPDIIRGY